MIKSVLIDGKYLNMKVTANTPKRYREVFGKDLITDLRDLWKHTDKKTGKILDGFDFGTIERMAYIMAKQGNNDIADNIDDWLDTIENPQALYEAMPQIIGMWSANERQIATAKKQ